MAKRRTNYLNNKDMLREIHLSKISFCSFDDELEDNQQDIIVEDVKKINKTRILEGRRARALRLTKELGEEVKLRDVKDTDVVFRVMTDEHIPLVVKKKSKAKAKKAKAQDIFDELLDDENNPDGKQSTQMTQEELVTWAELNNVELAPMRCNFPPFFHYRVDENGKPYIVGKSHWKGGLVDGVFCKTHGKTTDKLALMYMKLCERYATRSNWRGYTYNDEMQGQALLQLTQIGLQFNEMKSQNPFAYYTAAVTNSFTRVLNIEKKMQNIRDDILEANGLSPSWTRQFENDKTDEKYLDADGNLK